MRDLRTLVHLIMGITVLVLLLGCVIFFSGLLIKSLDASATAESVPVDAEVVQDTANSHKPSAAVGGLLAPVESMVEQNSETSQGIAESDSIVSSDSEASVIESDAETTEEASNQSYKLAIISGWVLILAMFFFIRGRG